MKKKTLTEQQVLEDFQRAVVFLTLLKIKKHFKNVSEYARAKHTGKAKFLHIDSKILKKLSRLGNAYCFMRFLKKSAHLFEFHKHVAWKYRSGKTFKINSWFELKLSIDDLDSALKSKLYMDLKSDLYSKRVHKILDGIFYNGKKEGNMTKAEKEAVYKKYADGKGAFTSPEFEIKQIEKKERSQKRRQETIAKKAVQASFEEFAKLKAENEQLKAEIAKLKQLKDLSSDIPEEEKKQPTEAELEDKQADEIAKSILPDFVADGSDIPDCPPEPAPVKPPADDIPEKEPAHPSKVLPRLAEFVKKCYIGPSTASRLAALYGENQEFKSPKVECDAVAALQSHAKQRLTVLSTALKELSDKLLKKDLVWLASNIKRTSIEIKTSK